jgi:hypothetical protein
LVSIIKGRIWPDGFGVQGAKENIWTAEGLNSRLRKLHNEDIYNLSSSPNTLTNDPSHAEEDG